MVSDVAAVVVECGLELMSIVELLRVLERSHTAFDSLNVRFGVTELLGLRVLGFSQFFLLLWTTSGEWCWIVVIVKRGWPLVVMWR